MSALRLLILSGDDKIPDITTMLTINNLPDVPLDQLTVKTIISKNWEFTNLDEYLKECRNTEDQISDILLIVDNISNLAKETTTYQWFGLYTSVVVILKEDRMKKIINLQRDLVARYTELYGKAWVPHICILNNNRMNDEYVRHAMFSLGSAKSQTHFMKQNTDIVKLFERLYKFSDL